MRLTPTGAITGRLLDTEGRPLAGATVRPWCWDKSAMELERYLIQRHGQAQTGADGRFRLEGIFPGLKYDLAFHKGPTGLASDPECKQQQLPSGRALDLGDIRTRPR